MGAKGTVKKDEETKGVVDVSRTEKGEHIKAKTTEAVLEAVTHAEQKPTTDEDKKATAAVEATMEVLKTEGVVDKSVSADIIAKARQEGTQTFKELDEAKVGTKAAAD